MNSEDNEDTPISNLRYVLSDLVIGMYIIGCLAIDVFVIFQIYVYYPTEAVAILSILLAVALAAAEVRGFRLVKQHLEVR